MHLADSGADIVNGRARRLRRKSHFVRNFQCPFPEVGRGNRGSGALCAGYKSGGNQVVGYGVCESDGGQGGSNDAHIGV
jgi:hypothetical protein